MFEICEKMKELYEDKLCYSINIIDAETNDIIEMSAAEYLIGLLKGKEPIQFSNSNIKLKNSLFHKIMSFNNNVYSENVQTYF